MTERGPQRQSRREALRKLAAAGGLAGTGMIIVSSPAFADSGSVACRPPFASVSATVVASNPPGNSAPEFIRITTPSGFTSCPCGGVPQYQFSFRIGSNFSGWTTTNTYSINTGSAQTVAAAVRVTCAGGGGPAVKCLYSGELTAVLPGNNSTTTYVLPINLTGARSGLPIC